MRALCIPVLLLAAELPAQERVLGILRTPAGEPAGGAEVCFVPESWPDVPALEGFQQSAAPRYARADERGQFRLPAITPGGLLVTTPEGLGAWRRPVAPGVPERIVLQPMAEVVLEGGGSFRAWPAALGEDGRVHPLPAGEGPALRLPAGSYEVWLSVADRPAVHRMDLLSGQRVRVPDPPPARFLHVAEDFRERVGAWPLGRPDVALPTSGRALALPGSGAPFVLVLHDGEGGSLHRLWIDADQPLEPWSAPLPDATERRRVLLSAEGAAEPRLWLLRGGPGAWDPIALFRGPGPHRVPLDPALEWLAEAQGAALNTGPALQVPPRVALEPGVLQLVQVQLPDGQPAAGALLSFAPAEGRAARLRAHTDARGQAVVGPLPRGGGTLRVSDPRGLPVRISIEPGPEVLRVRLEPGATLSGTVSDREGRPAAGVPVSLRDTQDSLEFPERTVLTDAEGAFAFTGLPNDRVFVLRAAVVRGAVTLAAQVTRAVPRAEPWLLQLRTEDPALPGRGR